MPIHDHGRGPVFRAAVTGLLGAAAALLADLDGFVSQLDARLVAFGLAALSAGMGASLSLYWSLNPSLMPPAPLLFFDGFKKNVRFCEPLYPSGVCELVFGT